MAATLFFMQQEKLDISPSSKKPLKAKTPAKKRNTVYEQVDKILQKLTIEEIRQYIHEYSENDSQFRKAFLLRFRSEINGESKKFYSSQIKAILRAVKGRDHFIPYNRTSTVWKEVNALLVNAQRHLEKGKYQTTFFIATAVLEEMNEALQFADDSNGDIGSCIECAMDLIYKIVAVGISEDIRKQVITYCITKYNSEKFEGWDWHLQLLDLAILIQKTVEEATEISEALDAPQTSEYTNQKIQELKLALLKRTGTEKDVEAFIKQNLVNPVFRRDAIAGALNRKEFDKAIKLAYEGIEIDKMKRPGLVADWYVWLLKCAQLQKQKDKIIEYARILYLKDIRNTQDYYGILKETIEKTQWDTFVVQLVREITAEGRWYDYDKLAAIYIREQWWNELLELLQTRPSLNSLERYEEHLKAQFPDKVIELYELAIIEYLLDNTGRGHYKTACRYLRRMKKLGAGKRVDEMIVQLKKEHPTRYALIEELNEV